MVMIINRLKMEAAGIEPASGELSFKGSTCLFRGFISL